MVSENSDSQPEHVAANEAITFFLAIMFNENASNVDKNVFTRICVVFKLRKL